MGRIPRLSCRDHISGHSLIPFAYDRFCVYSNARTFLARLVELADTKDLGSFAGRHAGSTPASRTIFYQIRGSIRFFPGRSGIFFPLNPNVPETFPGRLIQPVKLPFFCSRSKRISPCGCGIAPETCRNAPGDGNTFTFSNPHAAGRIPTKEEK